MDRLNRVGIWAFIFSCLVIAGAAVTDAAAQRMLVFEDNDEDGLFAAGVDRDLTAELLATGEVRTTKSLVIPKTAQYVVLRGIEVTNMWAFYADHNITINAQVQTASNPSGELYFETKTGNVTVADRTHLRAPVSINMQAGGDVTVGSGSQLRVLGDEYGWGKIEIDAKSIHLKKQAYLETRTHLYLYAEGEIVANDRVQLMSDDMQIYSDNGPIVDLHGSYVKYRPNSRSPGSHECSIGNGGGSDPDKWPETSKIDIRGTNFLKKNGYVLGAVWPKPSLTLTAYTILE